MLSKKLKRNVGIVILTSQLFSAFSPALTFAASQNVSGTDTKNALETVGTKANRLKTIGSSGVDESSGAFTYSYPIQIPIGKMGLEPQLSISYNSQSSENGIFGYGMSFTIPSIERTSRYGVDKIYTKNDFVSSLGGELILKSGSTNEYIQKIDDGSYQLYSFKNNILTMTDRSGNVYTFGSTLDSRLSDEMGNKIHKYFLTEVKDTLGNKIKYFYEKKNGFVYPKEIIYTQDRFSQASNKIVFERELRPDMEISYRSGFKVSLDDRIKSIKIFTDNILVGQVDLAYTTGQNGNRTLLSSISESRMGTDGLMTTIPATKFEYQKDVSINKTANINVVSGQSFLDMNGDAKPEYFSLTNEAISGTTWKIIDFDGNYLPDLYNYIAAQTMCSGYCIAQLASGKLKVNNGSNNFTTNPIVGTTFPTSAVYNNFGVAMDSSIFLSDINGDGMQDITSGTGYLNMGGTFTASTFVNQSIDQMIDVNGDGLPDLIKGTLVYLNNGTNWNTNGDTKYIVPFQTTVLTDKNGAQYDAGVRYTDINNDGLIDIVRAYIFNNPSMYCYTYSNFCGTSINEVYINNGNGWALNSNIKLTNYIANYSGKINMGVLTWDTTFNDFSDTIADGNFYGTKQDILKMVVNPLGAKSEITYKASATGNNPKLPINMLIVDQIKETEIKSGLIETTNYVFENGKMYFNQNNIYDRRFAGFGKVTTIKGDQKTIKYFHQGDSDDISLNERGDSFYNIGKIYHEELWAKNSGIDFKYSESYKNFGNYIYGGQIYNYPKYEVTNSFDNLGGKLTEAISYEYDLASRLPKQITNFGEASFNLNTGVISDIGEDTIISKNLYNTKRPQKLLSEEIVDVNGKFLDKKVYFYDELPFGYVERGLLTETRNYSTANVYVKNTNIYNEKGLISITIDNNGNQTTFSYDANNNPETITNALGQKNNAETNKWLGVQTKTIDANGKIVQTVYDGFGRVKNISTTLSNGNFAQVANKSYVYGVGFSEIENILKDGVIYKTITKNYDTFGRLISETESVGNSSKKVDYTYNNLGQLISTTYPYDANGILGSYNSSIDTKYSYDSLGRAIAISQGENTSNVTYSVNSKTTSDNTISGHKKTYVYNSQDKIISVTEKNGANTYTTKYSWNLLGNLTSIIDAEGNIRNFAYDNEGRLLKQEDLHNPTDNKFGVYTYNYDAIGNLLVKTDPTLNKFSYSYDNLYRPISEITPSQSTNYIYDNCQNGVGKICSINNSEYSQNYKYKVTGEVVSESKIIDGKNFTNTYSYNSLGQVTNISLPDNSVLNYSYENNGKQKSVSLVTVDGKTTNFVNDAKYNIDGTIKEISYGNNTKSCYNYSNNNGAISAPRLSDIYTFVGVDCANASKTNSNNLFVENLSYNKEGAIIKNTQKYVKDTSDIVSNFTYDELNRLTASSVLENNLTKVNNTNYSPIGNILSSDSINYSYSGIDYVNPHAPTSIGGKNITYDPNGNVLNDGKNVYNWSEKNTLKKQENEKSISQYVYDLNGERIKEIVKVKSSATETSQYSVSNDTYITFAQATTTKIDTYVSENTFVELNNAKITSENKIAMLFSLAYETGYPQKACVAKLGITPDPDCQKKEAQKFVSAFLLSKYNIQLANTTLEEMYQVFLGKLLVGNSLGDYVKDSSDKYVNKINVINISQASVSTTTLGTEIVGKNNLQLYGFVYKENKIPSLFGATKLISKETFTELSLLGISYTNLIIYDRLISYNMNPYSACDILSGEELINCKKTILVKYLFAITKYEKGLELSNVALDEMAEVIIGNLNVPNNLEEYKVKETKTYNISNSSIYTNNAVNTYGFFYYPKTETVCNVGIWSNPNTNYYNCDLGFTIPQDVINRKNEIETVTADFIFNQNRIDSVNNSSAPTVTIYPIVNNISPYFQNFGYSAEMIFPINTFNNYSSDSKKVNIGQATTFDITKITKGFATKEFTNYGIRLMGWS